MKTCSKWLISLFMAVFLAMMPLTVSAAGDIASGTLGSDANGTSDSFPRPYVPWRAYCKSIRSAEISVTGMRNASDLFFGCKNLTSVDLSRFDSSEFADVHSMFYGCSSLTTIQAPRNRSVAITLPRTAKRYAWQLPDKTTVKNIPKDTDSVTVQRLQTSSGDPIASGVSNIKLSGISKKIAAGKKIKLTAKVQASTGASKKLKWKSSNSKVATVTQKGAVTLKKNAGGKSVTITATATDGSEKKKTITIAIK